MFLTKAAKKDPKILYFDIESMGLNSFNADLGVMVCFGYQWEGEKAKCISLVDFPGKDAFDDTNLLKEASKILEEADLLVGHFASGFDRPFINSRLLRIGLPPISNVRLCDTCRISQQHLKLSNNRLDNVAKFLNVKHRKIDKKDGWPNWWLGAMKGSKKAIKDMSHYCITPDHKLLSDDMRWKEASEFHVGDIILGFDENGPRRKYRKAVIERMNYCPSEVFEVKLQSGKIFKVTADHKWLVGVKRSDGTNQFGTFKWLRTDQLASTDKYKISGRCSVIPKLFNVWTEETSKDAGWLAGIIDGEGNLCKHNGSIGIAQNPGSTPTKISKLVDVFAPGHYLHVVNKNMKCQRVTVKGNLFQRLEFLGKIRPGRLLEKIDFDNLGRLESRNGFDGVVSVTPIGIRTIVEIQTSTGTFVCDGYPMHNCIGDVETVRDIFIALKPIIPSKYLINARIGTERSVCTACGSNVQYRGTYMSEKRIYKRFVCTKCGRWGHDRKPVMEEGKEGLLSNV